MLSPRRRTGKKGKNGESFDENVEKRKCGEKLRGAGGISKKI